MVREAGEAEGSNFECLNSAMQRFGSKLIFTKEVFIKETELLFKKKSGAFCTGHLKQQ